MLFRSQVLNQRKVLGVGDVVTYVKVVVMHVATQRTLKETIGRRGAFAFRHAHDFVPSRGFKTSYNNILLQANSCWLPAQPGTLVDVLRLSEDHTTHPLGANGWHTLSRKHQQLLLGFIWPSTKQNRKPQKVLCRHPEMVA